MRQNPRIKISKDRLARFCESNHINRLSLYGSVLGHDFSQDSDIDMLIEFEPGTKAGFFKLAQMENELSEILGRKVDLRTPAELSRYFRQDVLENAKVEYAKG
ncbi:MAG: nucleotidyltransferase domain-containing protein [Desulfobacteraceae bacterium]|jgi:predicted nucleotidyltransferase|nr:nucleotidyltransferase domain-containing protein [Desulfobacteraceae bacterium]